MRDAWWRKLREAGVEELDARMPMKGTIHDIDAQRARWLRYRTSQRLTIEAGEDFALGGLGRYIDGLDLRLAFVPEDPDAAGVPLDSDTFDWLKERRPTPYGGPPPQWGNQGRATSSALVMYDQYRDDAGWVRCLALHRHGGIELSRGNLAYQVRDKGLPPPAGRRPRLDNCAAIRSRRPLAPERALRTDRGIAQHKQSYPGLFRGRLGGARNRLLGLHHLYRGPDPAPLGSRRRNRSRRACTDAG